MDQQQKIPTGADRVVEILRDEGVEHVFGNPGSTELALVDAIIRSGDIHYHLNLHEGCVVPMADGFAQATGRPVFVNLHTMSGLGNAIGVLANVKANCTPMVVTAGQQDRPLLPHDPLLSYDLVGIARPVVKWAAEARSEAELSVLLRRAFIDAMTPPMGPVFIALPHDLMMAPAPTPPPRRSNIAPASVAFGVEEIATTLNDARNIALVVGQELATSAGSKAIIALAEKLGAPMFGAFNAQSVTVPPAHPLWRGDLPSLAKPLTETLAPYDCVLYAGGQAFQLFMGGPGPVLPESTRFIHIAPSPAPLGRSEPTSFGTFGDLPSTLEAVTKLVAARPMPAALAPTETPASSGLFDALAAARILIASLPSDGILHNELPTVGFLLRALFANCGPGQFFSSKQTIGWAMGAAVGVSLGHEKKKRSLAIVGDGSAAFSLSALWSAARENVPVIFAIVDNSGYAILENMTNMILPRARANWSPAFDLSDPPVDFATIAKGYGVPSGFADDADSLRTELERAYAQSGPYLIHVKVAR